MNAPAHAESGGGKGIVQLIIGSAIISMSGVFVKIANVGPTEAGVYRNIFGAIALLVYVAVRRETLWRGWKPLGFAVIAGAFFAADLYCWHRSIHFIGPGLATILGNFQVFFLAAAGILVFKESSSWRFFLSIPLAITGLVMLVGLDWRSLPPTYRSGVVFGFLTAVMYAGYLLTMRRVQRMPVRLSAGANLAIVTIVTALLLSLVVVGEGGSFAIPDAKTGWILAFYGVFCQAIGWIVISHALRIVPASRAGLLLLLQPTLTFIWDILFFHRPTSGIESLGALIALGAIYLGNSRRVVSTNSGA